MTNTKAISQQVVSKATRQLVVSESASSLLKAFFEGRVIRGLKTMTTMSASEQVVADAATILFEKLLPSCYDTHTILQYIGPKHPYFQYIFPKDMLVRAARNTLITIRGTYSRRYGQVTVNKGIRYWIKTVLEQRYSAIFTAEVVQDVFDVKRRSSRFTE